MKRVPTAPEVREMAACHDTDLKKKTEPRAESQDDILGRGFSEESSCRRLRLQRLWDWSDWGLITHAALRGRGGGWILRSNTDTSSYRASERSDTIMKQQ